MIYIDLSFHKYAHSTTHRAAVKEVWGGQVEGMKGRNSCVNNDGVSLQIRILIGMKEM